MSGHVNDQADREALRTIPIDSTDAREQREAEAEEANRQAASRREHDAQCRGGWLGEDDAGRLRPCQECRPHLVTLPDGRVVHYATLVRRRLEES